MMAQVAGPTFQQWMLILALTIFIIVIFNIGRRRRTDVRAAKQYRREIDSATRQSTVVQQDLETLIVELNELARTINGQIDTRFAKLERSIFDADRRIKELRSLLQHAGVSLGSPDDGVAPPAGRIPSFNGGLDVLVDDPHESRFEHSITEENREASGFAALGYPPPVRESSPSASKTTDPGSSGDAVEAFDRERPGDVPSSHDAITQLAESGCSSVEIAEALNMAVGEVELILHLRRRAMKSAESPGRTTG